MTLVDLLKDLLDASKERLKNPITSAFILTFIIYNWRPIIFLLFSKTSIEDRIIIVNHEYCNLFALIIPLIIALGYTLGLPYLMMKIDHSLVYPQKKRLENIYTSKKDVVDLEIGLAYKIFDLKNVESGNKDKQGFLDRIEELQNINTQFIESNKNTLEQLRLKLEESNKTIQDLRSTNENLKSSYNLLQQDNTYKTNEKYINDNIFQIVQRLSPLELDLIKSIEFNNDSIGFSKISPPLFNKLFEFGIFEKIKNDMILTKFGKQFVLYVKTNNR